MHAPCPAWQAWKMYNWAGGTESRGGGGLEAAPAQGRTSPGAQQRGASEAVPDVINMLVHFRGSDQPQTWTQGQV